MRITCYLPALIILLLGGCQAYPNTLSDHELISGMNRRENQAWSYWSATSERRVYKNGFGTSSGTNINWENINTYQATARERAEKNPKPYLVMLQSKDPEVIMTFLWLLHVWAWSDADEADPMVVDEVAIGLRNHCLTSPDARIRYLAMQMLGQMNRVEPQDVNLGMSARDGEVRYATYLALTARSRKRWDPAQLVGQPDSRYIRQLQSVMIAHLADDDWLNRICAAEVLWATTTPKDREGLPPLGPAGLKRRALIDASQEDMAQTQKAWAAWYETKYR